LKVLLKLPKSELSSMDAVWSVLVFTQMDPQTRRLKCLTTNSGAFVAFRLERHPQTRTKTSPSSTCVAGGYQCSAPSQWYLLYTALFQSQLSLKVWCVEFKLSKLVQTQKSISAQKIIRSQQRLDYAKRPWMKNTSFKTKNCKMQAPCMQLLILVYFSYLLLGFFTLCITSATRILSGSVDD
jgi:hypothetical protein